MCHDILSNHRGIGICIHVYCFSLVLSRFPRIWRYWWRLHCTFVVFCMLTLISVCFVPIYNDFRFFLSSLEIFCLTILHRSLLAFIVPSGATELIPIFSAVCVVRFLVFCLVFCGLLFCHFVCFSFNWLWCVACLSWTYGFGLPLWNLQTLLIMICKIGIFNVILHR
jgi:hypothetical protein